jgi:hypothetical protein
MIPMKDLLERREEESTKHQPARDGGATLRDIPGVFAYEDLCDLIPLKNRTCPGQSEARL